MCQYIGYVLLTFCITGHICFTFNGKDYETISSSEDGVSKTTIYLKSHLSTPWIVKSVYNKTYLKTGWDTFDIESNPEIEDSDQAFLAGYVEGIETQKAIYDHYYNIIRSRCDNDTEVCNKINIYLDTNTQWIKGMIEKYASSDMYWRQVNLFYQQLAGVTIGYNVWAPPEEQLTFRDVLWMNFNWDLGDLWSVNKNESNQNLLGTNDHCSALIKLLDNNSDLFVSHNTWTGYETMRRIAKRYTLNFHQVVGKSMSFSGYPGILVSGDDFYIINSGLVAQETTNGNNNASLWAFVQPVGQVLEVVRVTVANRLAQDGRNWAKLFSQYNSGTYNNQWMIVDINKFYPGTVKPELLWIVEQIPGYIRKEDQTAVLTGQGYWASYNRPFYPDIFNMSGNQQLVTQYGDFFTYDRTPRSLIFKRDQKKVVDIHSMLRLMRSNDFQHDPLSRCNCSPPYSAENAIASRNDLNLVNGTYPFHALSHRSSGATDAKVTSYVLAKKLSFLAVSGPTTGAHLPPFRWSRSDFNTKLPHRGHPDLFSFQPVFITWP